MLENTLPRVEEKSDTLALIDELLEKLCGEHQISIEQLVDYLNDASKFDAKKWQEMQAFRQKLEDDLTCRLENISDPVNTQNKYKELEQARRWIPMR